MKKNPFEAEPDSRHHPFRGAVLRGLGILLPPLLTIVILAWIFNTVQDYVLQPVKDLARSTIHWNIDRTLEQVPGPASDVEFGRRNGDEVALGFTYAGRRYVWVEEGRWIPQRVYNRVQQSPGPAAPRSAQAYYERYIELQYLKNVYVIPVFLCLFVLFLYFLGRFLAAGVGRIVWNSFERLIHHLPIIRVVYSSVKQVTDFIFTESEIEFTRVVAVEYPRKGTWSVGFVTGESLPPIRAAVGEPLVSVLIPSSPMPATGYTITVRKGETIDLNISIDQAFQFIVSCGVVLPPFAGPKTETARQIQQAVASGSPPDRSS